MRGDRIFAFREGNPVTLRFKQGGKEVGREREVNLGEKKKRKRKKKRKNHEKSKVNPIQRNYLGYLGSREKEGIREGMRDVRCQSVRKKGGPGEEFGVNCKPFEHQREELDRPSGKKDVGVGERAINKDCSRCGGTLAEENKDQKIRTPVSESRGYGPLQNRLRTEGEIKE